MRTLEVMLDCVERGVVTGEVAHAVKRMVYQELGRETAIVRYHGDTVGVEQDVVTRSLRLTFPDLGVSAELPETAILDLPSERLFAEILGILFHVTGWIPPWTSELVRDLFKGLEGARSSMPRRTP